MHTEMYPERFGPECDTADKQDDEIILSNLHLAVQSFTFLRHELVRTYLSSCCSGSLIDVHTLTVFAAVCKDLFRNLSLSFHSIRFKKKV